ncbi:MAG TPA: hypothetical protein VGQ51_14135, partial [Puia sp.]|nr:hypothetical protein [Puia sp.]
PCYLPTWYFSLVRVKQRITQIKDSLFPSEFKGLSQREIFEIILKSNQFGSEYHPDFLQWLPQTMLSNCGRSYKFNFTTIPLRSFETDWIIHTQE